MLSNENDTDVILLFKTSQRGRRGKTLAKFVYYFMDGLLQTFSHIRIRLMKSSFDLLLFYTSYLIIIFDYQPYKSSLIIFFEQKVCGKVKHKLRFTSSDVRFTSANELRVKIHELRVQFNKLRVQIHELAVQMHGLRVQIHEFKSTSYVFKPTSYEFKSTIWKIESTSWETKSTSQEIKRASLEIKRMS